MDPIADQFPHVNSYNYAENEPVANIDLHGLQRFYGADGSLLGKYGDSQEERVVHRPNDAIKVQKVLIEGTSIQKKMFMPEFLSSKFSAELFRAEDLNSAYDMFAIKYKNNVKT